jgi:transcriptional regulator with XRE-family HTH domain
MKVNQRQLAAALSGSGKSVSVPLISSWETGQGVPPESRLYDIATFFATPRSFDGKAGRLLSMQELTEQERSDRDELAKELIQLRERAVNMVSSTAAAPSEVEEIAESLSVGPFRFEVGQTITIVCAELPPEMLQAMAYTDPQDPDYIEMNRYSDLGSLVELHGHLRAANPTSQVNIRFAHQLTEDDYTSHLVALGGVDWNRATSSVLDFLQLPVRQVSRVAEDDSDNAYFEAIGDDGAAVQHFPQIGEAGGRKILRADVALFARAVNPFNQKRTVTICNGMYGRGTYGAVRALTDARFRDRNGPYVQEQLTGSTAFCLLTRVIVVNNNALTPDWTLPENRLFEWSKSQ